MATLFAVVPIAVQRTGLVPNDSSTTVRGRLEAVVCLDGPAMDESCPAGSPPLSGACGLDLVPTLVSRYFFLRCLFQNVPVDAASYTRKRWGGRQRIRPGAAM